MKMVVFVVVPELLIKVRKELTHISRVMTKPRLRDDSGLCRY